VQLQRAQGSFDGHIEALLRIDPAACPGESRDAKQLAEQLLSRVHASALPNGDNAIGMRGYTCISARSAPAPTRSVRVGEAWEREWGGGGGGAEGGFFFFFLLRTELAHSTNVNRRSALVWLNLL